ncbi:hypothetical protein T492DRAFT_846521 [Pavlovales sp. CCMP2436]|nr:hypothetical protein T492DRAFT_846521 [Pavlovales sp. CCMP2436]
MYEGFEAFLTGELGNKTESSFVNVPYVDPSTRHLCQDRAARPEILSNTMDQAWHYYKFIVKQQKPADWDFNPLVDWNSELRYGEERLNWDSYLKPRHRGGHRGGGGGGGGRPT